MNKIILTPEEYQIYLALKEHSDTQFTVSRMCDTAHLAKVSTTRSRLNKLVGIGVCIKFKIVKPKSTVYQLKPDLDNNLVVQQDKRFTTRKTKFTGVKSWYCY